MGDVDYARSGAIGSITLNNPATSNALNWEVARSFDLILSEIVADPPSVILVRSRGKAFCAGFDRAEMHRMLKLTVAEVAAERAAFYEHFARLSEISVPTIAVLEGPAITGGVGLAALCDFRLGTPLAWIQVTFNQLGLYPGLGLSRSLEFVMSRKLRNRMLLLGERIDPMESHAEGFFDWLVPANEVEPELSRICSIVVESDPVVVREIKSDIAAEKSLVIDQAIKREALLQAIESTSREFHDRAERFMSGWTPSP